MESFETADFAKSCLEAGYLISNRKQQQQPFSHLQQQLNQGSTITTMSNLQTSVDQAPFENQGNNQSTGGNGNLILMLNESSNSDRSNQISHNTSTSMRQEQTNGTQASKYLNSISSEGTQYLQAYQNQYIKQGDIEERKTSNVLEHFRPQSFDIKLTESKESQRTDNTLTAKSTSNSHKIHEINQRLQNQVSSFNKYAQENQELSNKITLNHSRIYEDSQEQFEDQEIDMEEEFDSIDNRKEQISRLSGDQTRTQQFQNDQNIDRISQLSKNTQIQTNKMHIVETNEDVSNKSKTFIINANNDHQKQQLAFLNKDSREQLEDSFELEERKIEQSNQQKKFQMNQLQTCQNHVRNSSSAFKRNKRAQSQNDSRILQQERDYTPNSDTTINQSAILFQQMYVVPNKEQPTNLTQSPQSRGDLFMASHFNSTGNDKEWALDTLLKDEKVNVKHLEERNQALKDRIQNLENMLKSSINNNNNTTVQLDSLNQMNLTNTNTFMLDDQSKTVSHYASTIQVNSPHQQQEDPYKQYLQQKIEQLQVLNQQYEQENQRLKSRLDDVLNRLEDFEEDRLALKEQNDFKMQLLEQKILQLEQELSETHLHTISEKDETIRQLQEHVKNLETQIYTQEFTGSQTQSTRNQHLQTTPLFQQSQTSFGGFIHNGKENIVIQNQSQEIMDSNSKQQAVNSGLQSAQDTLNYQQTNTQAMMYGEFMYERIKQLEIQIEETKQYYVSKLQLVDRQNQLNSTLANKTQTQSMDQRELTFGEKQRFFDQLALVEDERDQALRQLKVMQIENDFLMKLKIQSTEDNTYQQKQQANIEVVFNSIMDQRVREMIDVILMIDDALEISQPNKDLFYIMENLISQIELMSNNQQYEESQVNLFEKIIETSLLISQMKSTEEISQTLDKMRTFTLTELESILNTYSEMSRQVKEQALSQQDNQNQTINDQDEYWSDFSDEDQMIEEQEEKQIMKTLNSLQIWLHQVMKQGEIDVLKLFKSLEDNQEGLISLKDLHHALIQLGFTSDYISLANLIKNLEQKKQNYIDYIGFVKNLQQKPYTWWQEVLLNNCFETRTQINKEGNYNSILPQFDNFSSNKYLKFYLNVISEKLINNQSNAQKLQEVLQDDRVNYLTKTQFRNFILQSRINLTRFECHILFKYLEDEGKLFIDTLYQYLQNPNDFSQLKTKSLTNKQRNLVHQDSLTQLQQDSSDFTFLMQIIQKHVRENNFNLEEWFRCHDSQHNGTIDLEGFTTMFKNMEIPLSKIEIYSVFKQLVIQQGKQLNGKIQVQHESRIYFRDFLKCLINLSQNDEINTSQKSHDMPLQRDTSNIPQRKNSQLDQIKYKLEKAVNNSRLDLKDNNSTRMSQCDTTSDNDKENVSLNKRFANLYNLPQSRQSNKLQLQLQDSLAELEIAAANQYQEEKNSSIHQSKYEKCKNSIKIADLKLKIEKLVQKNSQNLQKSGLEQMGSTLGKASQMKINAIRQEYEKEKMDLNTQLGVKNKEIEGFSKELEFILKEMEVLNAKQNVKNTMKR
eukprot:403362573